MRHYKTTIENSQDHHYKLIPTILLVLPFMKKYRYRILLSIGFMVCAKLSTIMIPILSKPIYDGLSKQVDELILLPISLLIITGMLRFLSSLFNELRNLSFITAGLPSVRYISTYFFHHLTRLPLSYHLERKTGGLSRDIERGSQAIRNLFYNLTVMILPTIFELTAVFIILLVKYPLRYSLLMLTSILCYGFFTFFVARWRVKYRARLNQADSKANATAIDALLNYETVKYFNNEDHEEKRYNHQLGDWVAAFYKSEASLSLLNAGQSLIIATSLTFMMIFAASDVQKGLLTIGDFALINGFLMQVFIPLNVLGFVFKSIQTSVIDINQLMMLLDIKTENQLSELSDSGSNESIQAKVSKGEVQFDHVFFHYSSERAILKDLDFNIPAGSKVAIVGSSGSGKSTIARLLFRFYQPSHGRILIDQQDISKVDIDSLRQSIAVVPQDVVLFNDTIYYNIVYGNPQSTESEVKMAAEHAYLTNLIDSLPEGYQTLVGERGLKLSGGEKQRIAIARAILKNPKILILDEATSSLDSHSEKFIQQAIAEVTKSRTSFIIAHRLSTIVDVDIILVLEHGKLVEKGSHKQLINKQGRYAELWNMQESGSKIIH